MDDINKLNSSFFSGSSIQPGITSRIASQENSKRIVQDTEPESDQLDIHQISTQQPTQYKTAPLEISTEQPTQYKTTPIRIASQENAKRAAEDTVADDIQPKLYEKPPQSNTPVRIASQENAKRAVQNAESNQPTQISFSDTVGQAKAAIANLNPNAIKGMNQADAIKYTQNSIADLDKKMAQVANLSSMADNPKVQNNPNQAPIVAPNTQVSNNVSNVTNITSDYLRNITTNYRTTPQWRDQQG